eukprot:TRINITY_DN2858_c0_g1_i5.p1 TRINITY_DN2858_c0_g1~~TRINITY_DN2858_c0_g1_i5.p1  ORF type:complete len:126 (+),score=26.76 TRINITY_DN2858_c0_g1_i5:265-642(+)
MYYRDSDAAIIVYDITNRISYDVLRKWLKELKENAPQDIVLAIVGNKVDLITQEQVHSTEASQIAKEYNALSIRTSAKEAKGIDELFTSISERLEERDERKSQSPVKTRLTRPQLEQDKKNSGCC